MAGSGRRPGGRCSIHRAPPASRTAEPTREDVEEFLGFVVGGRPSRFMMHAADWERLYRFVEYVAALDAGERPLEDEVREAVFAALPRREEWALEIVTAYRHGLALLDRQRGGAGQTAGG